MSTNGNRGSSDSDGLPQAIAIVFILALAASVLASMFDALKALMRAAKDLFKTVVNGILTLLLAYLAIWAAALVVLPLLDLLVAAFQKWKRVREAKEKMMNASFPKHSLLQDRRYFDSFFWDIIEAHLRRQIAKLEHQKKSASAAKEAQLDRQIEDQRILRNLLLDKEYAFHDWKRDHLYRILKSSENRRYMTEFYDRVWRFCMNDKEPYHPFTLLVVSMMNLEPNHDPHRIIKAGIFLLSFGRLSTKGEGSQKALIQETQEERIQRTFSDKARFVRFMEVHLFEILGRIGPFIFNAGDIQDKVRKQHFEVKLEPLPLALPSRNVSASPIPAESESTRSEKTKEAERQEGEKKRMEEAKRREAEQRQREEEQHKIHAYKLAEEARKEKAESELTVLRKKYLGGLNPGMCYHQVKNGEGPFFEDIRDLAYAQISGDEQMRKEAFEEIRFNRFKFLDFWKQHELEILRCHDERMKLAKALGKDSRLRQIQEEQKKAQEQRRQQWIEEASQKALLSYREREKQVREGQVALADEEFGHLLAVAGEKVRERLTNQEHDLVLAFLQREIRALLERSGAEQEYFSPEARRAARHCNLFRLGRLPYSAIVEREGFERDDSLDSLVSAFYRHQEQWFIEFLSESLSLPEKLQMEIQLIKGVSRIEDFYRSVLPQNKAALMKLFQVFENEIKHGRITSSIS